MKKTIMLSIENEIVRYGFIKILEDRYDILEKTNKSVQEDLLITTNSKDVIIADKTIYLTNRNNYLINKEISQITYDIKKTELLDCISKNLNGEIYIEPKIMVYINENIKRKETFNKLPTRYKELIYKILEEKTNKVIGQELYLSEKTVKNCLTKLYKDLGIKNRKEIEKKFKNLLTRTNNDDNI